MYSKPAKGRRKIPFTFQQVQNWGNISTNLSHSAFSLYFQREGSTISQLSSRFDILQGLNPNFRKSCRGSSLGLTKDLQRILIYPSPCTVYTRSGSGAAPAAAVLLALSRLSAPLNQE